MGGDSRRLTARDWRDVYRANDLICSEFVHARLLSRIFGKYFNYADGNLSIYRARVFLLQCTYYTILNFGITYLV